MSNWCETRPPRGACEEGLVVEERDAVAPHLEDAAHYPGGYASGIAFPRTEAEVARVVRDAARVLPIGAQSSLTGGATPFGDVLLSTARLRGVPAVRSGSVAAQAGVTLQEMQAALGAGGAVYPPVPTFTGATAGGAVATNAAGAATFKYGSTREWVQGLTVVLANGEVLEVNRGECTADERGFVIATTTGRELHIPTGTYRMPDVPKRSAGYFAAPGMDLVDLFIGSEGTLGIVTEITFRIVRPAPAVARALILCPSERIGLDLVAELRGISLDTRRRGDPGGLDVCAIEHVDDRSLALVRAHGDLERLNVEVPGDTVLALLVEIELPAGTTAADVYDQIACALDRTVNPGGLVQFCRILQRFGLLDRTELAAPGDVSRQQQILRFREAVPLRVNELVGRAKRETDGRIEKTAADMIVPFERSGEMMRAYARAFESRGLRYAVWGHISDGNVHPNVLPGCYDDVLRGREAILECGRAAARLGGCPLAEHGVGRNGTKQALLRQLYGDGGIAEMKAVKRALDPHWKLAPGVIFPGDP